MATLRPDRLSRHVGAGLTFAVTIGLFAYGGYLLDGWLGASPAFLIVGVFLGGVGGFLHLVRMVAPELLPWGRRQPPPDQKPPTN
jgi:F0F1-type ATP synthase assembly protein I